MNNYYKITQRFLADNGGLNEIRAKYDLRYAIVHDVVKCDEIKFNYENAGIHLKFYKKHIEVKILYICELGPFRYEYSIDDCKHIKIEDILNTSSEYYIVKFIEFKRSKMVREMTLKSAIYDIDITPIERQNCYKINKTDKIIELRLDEKDKDIYLLAMRYRAPFNYTDDIKAIKKNHIDEINREIKEFVEKVRNLENVDITKVLIEA